MADYHKGLVKLKDSNCWFAYLGPIKLRIKDDGNNCTLQWGYGQYNSDEQEIEDCWVDEIIVLADILKKYRDMKNLKNELFKEG